MKITLRNLYYNTSLDIDQDSFTCMLDEDGVDWGTADASFTQISDIKGYGSKVSFTAYQTRNISIIGWLAANDGAVIKELKKPLSRMMNPSHDLELICNGYKIKCRASSSVKYATEYRLNNEVLCKFSLNFEAHYPFFTLANAGILTESKTEGGLVFPWIIPDELGGDVFEFIAENSLSYINNTGDIDTGFILECYAAYGSSKNIVVTNQTTGEFLHVDIVLKEFDKLIISTVTSDKYVHLVRDDIETDITYKVTRDSNFWQFSPGGNDLTIAAVDKSNLEFLLHYMPAFLEVVQ